jgi:cysteine desulfurase
MKIYLDNAATTPLLPEVVEVMTAIMQNDFGNPSSIHSHGRKAKTIIENARRTMAQTINASLSEIFFTSSATEANNMILKMAVQSKGIKRIISSPTEHHCVLHTLDYMAEQNLCEVVYLAVNTEGFIDMEELEMLLSEKNTPTLVSIMHANNEIGTLQDIENIALICQKYDALYHTDTVQTIGKIPIDIQ